MMAVPFPSALIRYERLKRNWSQEGLCEGICAVSYLSKIEQGKAEPGDDILQALMQRLDLKWHGGEEAQKVRGLLDELLEAELSMDTQAHALLMEQIEGMREICLNGPYMLDFLLLEQLHLYKVDGNVKALSAFEDCFTPEQRAIWLMIQERHEEALALMPVSYTYLGSGASAYFSGQYTQAMERLLQACTLAAEEGRARVLLQARTLLGNCYSDQNDYEAMSRHYQVAQRLAKDLGDEAMLESIRYNTAATQMQMGMYKEAYEYYRSLKQPYALALHKLAVCQEKLGMKEDALRTLDRVKENQQIFFNCSDYPGWPWIERMCALVRYRLEHPAYLRDPVYGEMLLSAYQDMKKELSNGYSRFHQPWVEEWYVATRQYKQAYELQREK